MRKQVLKCEWQNGWMHIFKKQSNTEWHTQHHLLSLMSHLHLHLHLHLLMGWRMNHMQNLESLTKQQDE